MYCDHEETDTRSFFFIAYSPSESTSLVISFDTDLINIGLSILDRLPTRTVFFRYDRYGSDEKYCHLNKFLQAVEKEEKRPSLQLLSNQRGDLGKILTSLCVVFKEPLQVILRPYRFCLQGSLDELFQNIKENTDIQIEAVCSVVRLLACGYFFKYRSACPQSATVDELLLESSGGTSYEKHRSLLNLLRSGQV